MSGDTSVVTNIVDDMTDYAVALKLYTFMEKDNKIESCKVLLETQRKNNKRNWEFILNKFPNDKASKMDFPLLIKAIHHCRVEIVKLLLRMSADPNITAFSDKCESAVMYAANMLRNNNNEKAVTKYSNIMQIIKLLLNAGADPNYRDVKEFETVLHTAVRVENIKLVNLLLFGAKDNKNRIAYDWDKHINFKTNGTMKSITKYLLFNDRTKNTGINNFQIECLQCLIKYEKRCNPKEQLEFELRDIQALITKKQNNQNYTKFVGILTRYLSNRKQDSIMKLIKYNDIGLKFETAINSQNDKTFNKCIESLNRKFKNTKDSIGMNYLLNEWNSWAIGSHCNKAPLLLQAIKIKFDTAVEIMLQDLNVCAVVSPFFFFESLCL